MFRKWANLPGLRILHSMDLLNICLILLAILTVWGTLYQVENGLYLAQQRFFNSWVFFIYDFIPFPGGQLVLWVLCLNLLSSFLFRFKYKLTSIGTLITHSGLILFFIGSFITFHYSEESHLTLAEGEGSNASLSYRDWELAVFRIEGGEREVSAIDIVQLDRVGHLLLERLGLTIERIQYLENATAMTGGSSTVDAPLNGSGITSIMAKEIDNDPTRNVPGIEIKVAKDRIVQTILLYGMEDDPTVLSLGGRPCYFKLRRTHYPLPFVLTLFDFKKEEHPGTSMAKSYESRVTLSKDDLIRDVVISMNNPLRFNEYTLYQSSYSDRAGRETSTLSVVKNTGKYMPYLASTVTILGMIVHFGLILVGYIKKDRKGRATR